MYKIHKLEILLMSIGLIAVSLLMSSCTQKKPISTRPDDYTYKLENTKIGTEYTLLDRLTAGSDGANLQSQTGNNLSHEFTATTGISITFPSGFEIGGPSVDYTFSTDDINLNGQLVTGLKKGQNVEFYYLKTDNVFGVYSKSDGTRAGTLTIPSVTFDFKVYDPDLGLIKDLGEPWLSTPDGNSDITTPKSVSPTNEKEYILPYSDTRKLTDNDLNSLTKHELRLARNEIYARYGRVFRDEMLQEYFDSKSWYKNIQKLPLGTDPTLTKLEIGNIELIQDYEAR